MVAYKYYIVNFKSVTDGTETYRYVIRPNNSKIQLVAISEKYTSANDAHRGIQYFQRFITDEIKTEARTLNITRKEKTETEHFIIWPYRRDAKTGTVYYMFEIREEGRTLITSAHAYEHKQNCIDEIGSIIEHADGNIENCEDPDALRFDREYFEVKKADR